MIASDHVDFVGVDVFAGFPEGRIEYQTMIKGLLVDDVERMKKPALRQASTKTKTIIGLPYKGGKSGANIDPHLDRLTKETTDERAKRKIKDAKRQAKEERLRRRLSQRSEGEDDEDEATDEE